MLCEQVPAQQWKYILQCLHRLWTYAVLISGGGGGGGVEEWPSPGCSCFLTAKNVTSVPVQSQMTARMRAHAHTHKERKENIFLNELTNECLA